MDLRKLKKLIDLVQESGISELEVTEGEEKVRIAKQLTAAPVAHQVYAPAPVAHAPAAPAAAPAAAAPAQPAPVSWIKPPALLTPLPPLLSTTATPSLIHAPSSARGGKFLPHMAGTG